MLLAVLLGACAQNPTTGYNENNTDIIYTITPPATKQINSTQVPASPEYEQELPSPPDQPTEGPGSNNYTHVGITETEVRLDGGLKVVIFEPQEPRPTSAPVILFSQGVGPGVYQEWINHVVRRGI